MLVGIIIGFAAGSFLGGFMMALVSARSYDKGYVDGSGRSHD